MVEEEGQYYTLPQAQLHPAFNALDQALVSRGDGENEEVFRLHTVNTIWPQQGYSFLDTFLNTLSENYGTGLQMVDFRQAEEARLLINQWVSNQPPRVPKTLGGFFRFYKHPISCSVSCSATPTHQARGQAPV